MISKGPGSCDLTDASFTCIVMSTLTILNAATTDQGEYLCSVSNAAGNATMANASLTVNGNTQV